MAIIFCYRLKIQFLLFSYLLLLLNGCSSQPLPVQHLQKTSVPQGRITTFAIGTPAVSIAAGPDGNLWFTEEAGKIGRITPRGVVTTFVIPSSSSATFDITAGPDGNLWFTEQIGKIGRITPSGTVTEFVIPTPSNPAGIISGSDGNLWFINISAGPSFSDQIGRITPAGVLTEFSVPSVQSTERSLATGPDGNIWFIEPNENKIGRITPDGAVIGFSLPNPNSIPKEIIAGPDGNLWFTESGTGADGKPYGRGQIGRITPNGTITEFSIPSYPSSPIGITAGPDGNLWFTESETGASGKPYGRGQIGRITPSGIITEFPISVLNNNPLEITAGSDGDLWFTEIANQIGHITSGK